MDNKHFEETRARVRRTIADGDGMLGPAGPSQYFAVGRSAIRNILQALHLADREPASIHRVLDYACGYGRVLRWLQAAFPEAYLLGVDADPKAAGAASGAVGVETRPLDITLPKKLADDPFDLIWVGSLFTHLPKAESERVIEFLYQHLAVGGVLVFTTHGHLVARRLQTKERVYNLTDDRRLKALADLDATGYGYGDYPTMVGYGTSVAYPTSIIPACYQIGMELLMYQSHNWAAHQDVYAFVRRT